MQNKAKMHIFPVFICLLSPQGGFQKSSAPLLVREIRQACEGAGVGAAHVHAGLTYTSQVQGRIPISALSSVKSEAIDATQEETRRSPAFIQQ